MNRASHPFRMALALLALTLAPPSLAQEETRPVDYVDPFIGTSNFGATHPGAQYPGGFASVVPFNVAHGEEQGNVFEKDARWHSRPYVFENTYLTGFSHANLSGVGCPDLGVILLMPTTGELDFDARSYGSTYTGEVARPGYYATTLTRYGVKAEVTSTPRTGLTRFTFPEGQANVLLNVGLGLTNETGGSVRLVSDSEVEGERMVGDFCYRPGKVRPLYFVARFSRPAVRSGAWKKMPEYTGVEAEWSEYDGRYKPYPGFRARVSGDDVGAYFSFDAEQGDRVEVKLGLSYVSVENARANLDAEQPGFDFAATERASHKAWDALLSRVAVKGGTQDQRKVFYTALYHLLFHPNLLQDVNGDYPLMGGQGTGNTGGKDRYTVFSLWDTYRNVHPLLSLVYPERQSAMVNSMVDMSKESGWLPKWELNSLEMDVMVGDPALPVIADTYLRGIRDFDVAAAYQAMKRSADTPGPANAVRPYMTSYLAKGYVPLEEEEKWGGSVASALEYYFADWNLGQLARALGHEGDAQRYLARAQGYRHYFDAESGFLRPKRADGSWLEPFDVEAGKDFEAVPGYVEGTAWNYRFYAPHDIPGLIALSGGPEEFVRRLDETVSDAHYDPANEPDIGYPFLYNYVPGQEWRGQDRVGELLRKHYTATPGGIPGNDDAGTLSAWAILAMMGLYPVTPGDMDFAVVSPVFDEISIALDPRFYPGGQLVIRKTGKGHIRSVRMNGKPQSGLFVSHQALVKGGELRIDLSPGVPNSGKH